MTDAVTKHRSSAIAGGQNITNFRSQAMIAAPRISHDHPNRLHDCQRSIVTDLDNLIDRATVAGWSRREVVMVRADLLDAEPEDAGGLLRTMVD
ncbi:hypothetical protein [Rhizobium sp. P28RR-XV]|uniref:hypothetical protein n=1 Tax=Rhizobium sp. P28RR-XV TaxID=2726737 RepID=UPI001457440D|nr:hypothetical protein [Rhizobium sp. P28RR-XV]NLR86319.1 hypothetical protein [Rhizobium sp. P28RR-XV]